MKINKVFLLLGLFLIHGCGTDTGNPTLKSPVGSIQAPTTDYIATIMCLKINGCFNPSLSNCETKIRIAPQIPTHLGLNETTYPNFDSIQSAIDLQTLQVDSGKSAACYQAISAASCADTNVQQSYSSSSIEDLNQAWKLLNIDPNCGQFIY